ncbi:MAG: PAS domain S-box protein [Candidatus Jettenia sp.]|nr:MAG: PAS domain S-box protein [Candidatus Jettenia sp. AMX1]MBC6928535.1 PAS domain S-box protein [Candidatus Jettenia sp.]NUN23975.1 PAS domain S-box protein [Candidatus Jettenia caeni]MCE7879755.1 PAS domain S-box protein [Candidatus Jettenia sp. AMX1]MCQ3926436.1 PAS domain S-box protein [Candidatus Jettenia sp.]
MDRSKMRFHKINPLLSMKGRLLIFAFSISLIPVITITTVYYLSARNTIKGQIFRQLRVLAESKKQHILSFMEGNDTRTKNFSSDGYIRSKFEIIVNGRTFQQHAVTHLNKYLSKNKKPLYHHLVAIILIDQYGKVISSTHENIIGMSMSGLDIFKQGLRKSYGDTAIGQPHYSSYLNSSCIFISAPIFSRQGKPIGVLINAYDLASLVEITTNRVEMEETGEVYLINKNKTLLTESRFIKNASLRQIINTEPVRKIMKGKKETVGIYKDYRGVPVVGASLYIPKYDWILLAEIDKAEVFAPLKMLGIIALIFGVTGIVAVMSIGIIFAVSTSKPIQDLMNATERFADGELDYRVKISHKDEIGNLSMSFNTMAGELARKIAEHTQIESELIEEIAERKRIENELRKLYNAVEQSPCTIVITDTKGSIEYANPKFYKTTGYTPKETIGQNPRILKSGEKPPEEYKHLWDTIISGEEWRGEFHNKRKNGELYWEYASISPIRNSEGVIAYFLAVKEDITERKRAEDELREQRDNLEILTNQLAASNKELEAFCYSVSHDLRAPLRSINGFCKAMMEDHSDTLDEQGKNYLQRVSAASQRMGQLIDDLLNLSRITRSEIQQKRVNLSILVENILMELREKQPERQIECIITKGLYSHGDSQLLRIALENLLNNAWKFTRKNTYARIEFGSTQQNGKQTYFIRDNGAGFDMAYTNKLFGAFQRLHSAIEFEGTGIGLATVQRVIHRHGGQIWAEGEVNKGAAFYFTLP